jgi:DNA repair photolyase
MIVSASYRTDIPAFYGRWFMNRLDEGSCNVSNPYSGKTYSVSLQPNDVDGLVFWTKNIGPFVDPLAEIHRRGLPFVVQYTINGYPAALERSVPDPEHSVKLLKSLSNSYGARAIVWRYDPIIESDLTPSDWHLANFSRLATALRGSTDEVVVSFAQIYQKTRRNLDAAARSQGFVWSDPDPGKKETLAKRLTGIAADNGMRLAICSQPSLLVNGIGAAKCIDSDRLSDVANRRISSKTKGNRPGCLCSESRDIGAYDNCPMGCAYCYAVRNRDAARKNHKAHDSDAMCLS